MWGTNFRTEIFTEGCWRNNKVISGLFLLNQLYFQIHKGRQDKNIKFKLPEIGMTRVFFFVFVFLNISPF